MDKSGIIKKMMSKKEGKEEDPKNVSITAEIETEDDEDDASSMEDSKEMGDMPSESIKLTVGDMELEGQELVDYVIENQEEIIKTGERDQEERKKIMEQMDY